MTIKFNMAISVSGLAVISNDKRYYNGVVEKEHNEDNHLDELSIKLDGGCEMEASETKEFILGIVNAVKSAAEVKIAQQNSKTPDASQEKTNEDEAVINVDSKEDENNG